MSARRPHPPEVRAELRRRVAAGESVADARRALGVGKVAYEWVSDPDGSKARARKDRLRGECVDCGAPTNGADGAPSLRCNACNLARLHDERLWTREACVLAVQEWADEHGGLPPSANDAARHPDLLPMATIATRECGGWNALLRAAGLEPRGRGQWCSHRRLTDAQRDEAVARYEAGEGSVLLARAFDVSPTAVLDLVRRRGVLRARAAA